MWVQGQKRPETMLQTNMQIRSKSSCTKNLFPNRNPSPTQIFFAILRKTNHPLKSLRIKVRVTGLLMSRAELYSDASTVDWLIKTQCADDQCLWKFMAIDFVLVPLSKGHASNCNFCPTPPFIYFFNCKTILPLSLIYSISDLFYPLLLFIPSPPLSQPITSLLQCDLMTWQLLVCVRSFLPFQTWAEDTALK